MDIAALSIVQNQGELQQQASIAVLKMAMDVVTDQGNAITALAQELSVYPYLGANIDIRV